MSLIAKLNTMVLRKPAAMTPAESRRTKLLAALTEQQALAEAHVAGTTYVVKVKRWQKDAEGVKQRIERDKLVKAWWWKDGDTLSLVVRYGAKALELSKGKRAIRVDKAEQLPGVFDTLRAAVQAGELDAAIEAMVGGAKVKPAKG